MKLERYSDLKDFEVTDSDQDIRGWEVFTGDKVKIGKVKELMVDTDAMRVKYFEVSPDDKIFTKGRKSDSIILPISMAHLEEKKKNVHISSVESRTELIVPSIDGVPANEQYYRDLNQLSSEDKFYEDKEYNDRNLSAYEQHNTSSPRLYRYKEHKDQSLFEKYNDVSGWDVYSNDNVKIGNVDDIVYDNNSKKIRYLLIDVRNKKKNILLPIGLAFIDEKDDKVYVDMREHSLYNLPEYRNEIISRDYESSLRQAIRHENSNTDVEDDFYNNNEYSQDRFYSRRHRGVWW